MFRLSLKRGAGELSFAQNQPSTSVPLSTVRSWHMCNSVGTGRGRVRLSRIRTSRLVIEASHRHDCRCVARCCAALIRPDGWRSAARGAHWPLATPPRPSLDPLPPQGAASIGLSPPRAPEGLGGGFSLPLCSSPQPPTTGSQTHHLPAPGGHNPAAPTHCGATRLRRGRHIPRMEIVPLCDIPSGCCSFAGPWTVTRSSLRMLRRVAAFCRPLRPVFLLVSFPRSRSPVVGVSGLR